MIVGSVLFAVFVLLLTAIISLAVAGIIRLIYMAVHRSEAKKTEAK